IGEDTRNRVLIPLLGPLHEERFPDAPHYAFETVEIVGEQAPKLQELSALLEDCAARLDDDGEAEVARRLDRRLPARAHSGLRTRQTRLRGGAQKCSLLKCPPDNVVGRESELHTSFQRGSSLGY